MIRAAVAQGRRAPRAKAVPRPAPVPAADLVQAIVARIEEDIVFRVLHPRERLIEDDLMARFGAKRHVVRQALVELERGGLVQRPRNSSARVRALTAREVTELYAVREILETNCVALVPLPVPAAVLASLEAIQREHAAAVARRAARDVFRANLAFHDAIHRLAGNDALMEAIADFARRTHPVRLSTLSDPARLEQARAEHEEILRALRRGDREALIAACSRHLRPAPRAYLQSLPPTP